MIGAYLGPFLYIYILHRESLSRRLGFQQLNVFIRFPNIFSLLESRITWRVTDAL
jgi:hypothetical protein